MSGILTSLEALKQILDEDGIEYTEGVMIHLGFFTRIVGRDELLENRKMLRNGKNLRFNEIEDDCKYIHIP